MNTKRRRRLAAISIGIIGTGIAAALILLALRQNIDLYYTPQQLLKTPARPGKTIRLGGLVAMNSVVERPNAAGITFVITDNQSKIPVFYHGVLPSLFREGKGVIVEGTLDAQHRFVATRVLAKHDENYQPPLIHSRERTTS